MRKVEDLVRKFATHGNPLETLSTTLSQHGSLTFVQSRRGVAIYHVQWHLLVEASTLDQAIDKLAQDPATDEIPTNDEILGVAEVIDNNEIY